MHIDSSYYLFKNYKEIKLKKAADFKDQKQSHTVHTANWSRICSEIRMHMVTVAVVVLTATGWLKHKNKKSYCQTIAHCALIITLKVSERDVKKRTTRLLNLLFGLLRERAPAHVAQCEI